MKKKRVYHGGGNLASIALEAYLVPDVLRKFEEACKRQRVDLGQFLICHLLAIIHEVADDSTHDLLIDFKEQFEASQVHYGRVSPPNGRAM